MELFSAAGVDLPSSGGPARRGRGVARTLRVPLFNYKVVQRARELAAFAPTPEQRAAAENYARQVRNPKFLKQKETAVRGVFIQTVLQTLLGYAPIDPEHPFTLAIEKPVRGGAVDVALGRFNPAEGAEELVAPFELKGPDTFDLDRVMPGRGRSPVQQAWDYAIDAPGSRWVLVSNCLEIRLYGFGRGRDAFELFDLGRLDEPEEHARLWLVLSQDRLLGGATDRLLRETDSAYKDITNALYSQYSALRKRLIQFLTDSVEGPKLTPLPAIETAQKLLDRVLFIAFAQRTDLLPDRLLEDASTERNKFVPQPIWQNFLALFRAVDAGNNRLSISAYNGGLFAVDPVADTLILPDDLAGDVAALGRWDYRREVPVTVLGHIFEQSITDIERDKALSRGEAPPPESKGKRKREGVVYTAFWSSARSACPWMSGARRYGRSMVWQMPPQTTPGPRRKSRSGGIIWPPCAISPSSIPPAGEAPSSWRPSTSWRGVTVMPSLDCNCTVSRSISTFSTRSSPGTSMASISIRNRSRSRGCRSG